MDQFRLDAAAMHQYTDTAAEVAARLERAATSVHAAADIERLTADLGTVGADFIASFITILTGHGETLTVASALVGGYGDALTQHTVTAAELDGDAAAAIGRTGGRLA